MNPERCALSSARRAQPVREPVRRGADAGSLGAAGSHAPRRGLVVRGQPGLPEQLDGDAPLSQLPPADQPRLRGLRSAGGGRPQALQRLRLGGGATDVLGEQLLVADIEADRRHQSRDVEGAAGAVVHQQQHALGGSVRHRQVSQHGQQREEPRDALDLVMAARQVGQVGQASSSQGVPPILEPARVSNGSRTGT